MQDYNRMSEHKLRHECNTIGISSGTKRHSMIVSLLNFGSLRRVINENVYTDITDPTYTLREAQLTEARDWNIHFATIVDGLKIAKMTLKVEEKPQLRQHQNNHPAAALAKAPSHPVAAPTQALAHLVTSSAQAPIHSAFAPAQVPPRPQFGTATFTSSAATSHIRENVTGLSIFSTPNSSSAANLFSTASAATPSPGFQQTPAKIRRSK
ncbi:hypothetical protein G7Y89_g11584 [Cudoniella acicularis]|uniref:Uncharacterized protein n=1 Tax=Cudoniella acicularis TaxID=354080 RepID=A0A8H4RE87_9HELO|nr:hypothetical protein G7Y89_g11584 [Cudoniella acicularis]